MNCDRLRHAGRRNLEQKISQELDNGHGGSFKGSQAPEDSLLENTAGPVGSRYGSV
jgi:hypothetical protein